MTTELEAQSTIEDTYTKIDTKYGADKAENYLLLIKKVVENNDFEGVVLLSNEALETNEEDLAASRIRLARQAISKTSKSLSQLEQIYIERSTLIYS